MRRIVTILGVVLLVLLPIYIGSYAVLSAGECYEPAAIGLGAVKAYAWAPRGFIDGYRWRNWPTITYMPLYLIDMRIWHTERKSRSGQYPVDEVKQEDIGKIYKACGLLTAEPPATEATAELQRLADPSLSGAEELRLIEHIRTGLPSEGEAKTWAQIANSKKVANMRRRHAVLQLFDRHGHVGMTVGKLASLLAQPAWLKKENVVEVRNVTGLIPVRILPGETVFVIVPRLPPDDKSLGVYLRAEGSPAAGAFYDALQGKQSKISTARITAIAIFVPSPEDQKLIDSQAEVKGGD